MKSLPFTEDFMAIIYENGDNRLSGSVIYTESLACQLIFIALDPRMHSKSDYLLRLLLDFYLQIFIHFIFRYGLPLYNCLLNSL